MASSRSQFGFPASSKTRTLIPAHTPTLLPGSHHLTLIKPAHSQGYNIRLAPKPGSFHLFDYPVDVRRATRTRRHSPNDQAAMKYLSLVVRSLDPTGRGQKQWNEWLRAASENPRSTLLRTFAIFDWRPEIGAVIDPSSFYRCSEASVRLE